jgi:hypothetical protein
LPWKRRILWSVNEALKYVKQGRLDLIFLDSKPRSGITLGIGIDQQNPFAALSQSRRQVHCRRRFADPALLIYHTPNCQSPSIMAVLTIPDQLP